jgi:hypothetical protein
MRHIQGLIFDISVFFDTEVDHGKCNDQTPNKENPCGDEDIPKADIDSDFNSKGVVASKNSLTEA